MELRELERHEVVVLAGLLRFAALADNRVSGDEAAKLRAISEAVGQALYDEAAAVAGEEIADFEALRERVTRVTRDAAKELIFGTVLDLSIEDSVDPGEGRLLQLLSDAWGVTVEFEAAEELAGGDDSDEEG